MSESKQPLENPSRRNFLKTALGLGLLGGMRKDTWQPFLEGLKNPSIDTLEEITDSVYDVTSRIQLNLQKDFQEELKAANFEINKKNLEQMIQTRRANEQLYASYVNGVLRNLDLLEAVATEEQQTREEKNLGPTEEMKNFKARASRLKEKADQIERIFLQINSRLDELIAQTKLVVEKK